MVGSSCSRKVLQTSVLALTLIFNVKLMFRITLYFLKEVLILKRRLSVDSLPKTCDEIKHMFL